MEHVHYFSIRLQPKSKRIHYKNSFDSKNMIVVDKGRSINERSAILIENGI
jgi:hypothetical protein